MAGPDPTLVFRLSRIEGQVRGVARMLEEKRYCIDILNQIRAIKAALRKVETQVIKTHADTCVSNAMKSGNLKEQRAKFDELVELCQRHSQ